MTLIGLLPAARLMDFSQVPSCPIVAPFGSLSIAVPTAAAGERIGIMGGSFNPPHEGHVLAARAALSRLGIRRLWIAVTPGNPLKCKSMLPTVGERMAAVRALLPERTVIVTGFESRLTTAYTAQTLAFLRLRLPAVRFVWVMGADNLANFHHWQRWRDIAATMPIAVVDRPGWRHRALSSPAAHWLARWRIQEHRSGILAALPAPAWVYLTTRLSEASSTAIRQQHPVKSEGTAD